MFSRLFSVCNTSILILFGEMLVFLQVFDIYGIVQGIQELFKTEDQGQKVGDVTLNLESVICFLWQATVHSQVS